MIVAGIDIGFAATGVVLFDSKQDIVLHCTVITTEKTARKHGLRVADDDVNRCMHLYRSIRCCLRDYSVGAMFVELPSSGAKSSRAVGCMARAQAIIGSIAEETKLPTEWLTPTEVKLAVVGTRDASKLEIQDAVLKLYPGMVKLQPKQKTLHEHAYDAAACYITGKNGNLMRMINSVSA